MSAPDFAAHTPAQELDQTFATQLPNGLHVLSQPLESVRSATLGIWITAGSRHEAPGQEGTAHFLEHMAFKGTARRSAFDIARELDRLGGMSNGFTGRETTCFYARVADTGMADALDILADIVLNPRLDKADMAQERSVVLQELAMSRETPDDRLHEEAWQAQWADPALGHSILGTADSVAAMTPAALHNWMGHNWRPKNLYVCCAGSVEHEPFVDEVASYFADVQAPESPCATASSPPRFTPCGLGIEQASEQAHVLLSFPSVGLTDERRFAYAVLASLLGGQMSSRLFQEVREKRGLAYTVHASQQGLTDCGVLDIYAATDPRLTGELMAVLREQVDEVAANGVSEEELAHTRDHLAGMLCLATESTEERLIRLAKNHSLFGRNVGFAETTAKLAAVTVDDVAEAAHALFATGEAGVSVLAPRIDPAWGEPFHKQLQHHTGTNHA